MVGETLSNGTLGHPHVNGLLSPTFDSSSEWVVQKFGGTSVGKFPLGIIEKVVRSVTEKSLR